MIEVERARVAGLLVMRKMLGGQEEDSDGIGPKIGGGRAMTKRDMPSSIMLASQGVSRRPWPCGYSQRNFMLAAAVLSTRQCCSELEAPATRSLRSLSTERHGSICSWHPALSPLPFV